MRRALLVMLLLAGCATSNAPRAEFDPHEVGAPGPTNTQRNDPLVYTHIETPDQQKPTGDSAACGSGCAADEVCDSSGTVHRCVKKKDAPAWVPGAQPASAPGK